MTLHTWLYDRKDAGRATGKPVAGRFLLPSGGVVDWREWQAGCVSGALLMLESFIIYSVEAYFRKLDDQSSAAPKLARKLSNCGSALPSP